MGSDAMGLGLGVGLGLDWEELGCGGPQCPGTFSSSDFPFARSQMFYKSFLCIFSCTSISQLWIFFPFAFSGLKVEWQTKLEMRTLAICFVER